MQIYRAKLELLDYVFYATVERGKVYETGAFIHNYALAYAIGLVSSETYTYTNLKQQPHYQDELTPLNNVIYLTPASPEHITYRLMQWNTLPERYDFPGKEPSIGYPDWGFARVLCPGSVFTFYLLVHDMEKLPSVPALRGLVLGNTVHIRLGKFTAKARLTLRAADSIGEKDGPFQVDAYLNWRDLTCNSIVCDILPASLPTRIIHHAHFTQGSFYSARFAEQNVDLPRQMSFLARTD